MLGSGPAVPSAGRSNSSSTSPSQLFSSESWPLALPASRRLQPGNPRPPFGPAFQESPRAPPCRVAPATLKRQRSTS
ncbi:hypothetical protein SKAU_G00352100 [Synaphobranchus kaupii]|uniref:Uncharacterized protein n=1 Tax=Synaphobranchus kaupii TaxID=118154 RepID=A0A9Q1II17_SYNKA|nr:hypothetical protein SKAU_G00352100 [Synaphobranchus kaupii]